MSGLARKALVCDRMPKSTDISVQAPPPVPDAAVLLRLSELARVPAEQREFFFESVLGSVQTACELDGLVKQGLASKRGKNLARAAFTLYDVLGNLNNRESSLIEGILSRAKSIFGKISNGGVEGLEHIAYQLALLSSLVTGKPPPRLPSQLPEPPVPGRRSGTVTHWIFQNFASELLISTSAAGGRLTLEKNTRKGSLVEAIRMLAPNLPDGFVPDPLTGSNSPKTQRCVQSGPKGIG